MIPRVADPGALSRWFLEAVELPSLGISTVRSRWRRNQARTRLCQNTVTSPLPPVADQQPQVENGELYHGSTSGFPERVPLGSRRYITQGRGVSKRQFQAKFAANRGGQCKKSFCGSPCSLASHRSHWFASQIVKPFSRPLTRKRGFRGKPIPRIRRTVRGDTVLNRETDASAREETSSQSSEPQPIDPLPINPNNTTATATATATAKPGSTNFKKPPTSPLKATTYSYVDLGPAERPISPTTMGSSITDHLLSSLEQPSEASLDMGVQWIEGDEHEAFTMGRSTFSVARGEQASREEPSPQDLASASLQPIGPVDSMPSLRSSVATVDIAFPSDHSPLPC